MKKINALHLSLLAGLLAAQVLFFQNCAPAFQTVDGLSKLASTGGRTIDDFTSFKTCGEGPTVTYSQILPLVQRNCLACHSGTGAQGAFRLDFKTEAEAMKDKDVWARAAARVTAGSMPTTGALSKADMELFKGFVLSLQKDSSSPGTVAFHRLNVTEYTNSVNDLFGIQEQFGVVLTPDPAAAYGFDNMASSLGMDTDKMEGFISASQQAVDKVFSTNKAQVMTCTPGTSITQENCAKQIVKKFATRAFRREVPDAEVSALARFAINPTTYGAQNFEDGVKLSLKAMLVSPHFLYRIVHNEAPLDATKATMLNDYELAARLSYFIWSSIPDETLMNAAASGELRNDATLRAQIKRMLSDEKGKRFASIFASRWFDTKNIVNRATPNRTRHTTFTDELRADMAKESELFFQSIVKDDRPMFDVLEANYTFVNKRLADHYGLSVSGATNETFQKVTLTDPDRYGFLGQAAFLTMNAGSIETSPTKRGAWIMGKFLCDHPPAAPLNVEPVEQGDTQNTNIRQIMIAHRESPACISCHVTMDPIGFSLDTFDAIGKKRTTYENGDSLDVSGVLPTGEKFVGPQQLREVLKANGSFETCATEHLMAYGVGRKMGFADQCSISNIATQTIRAGARFSEVIMAVVKSPQFQYRTGKGE